MNIYKKILIVSLFLTVVLISIGIFTNQVFAGSATLTWNANTESDLAGYKIYYGTSPRTGSCPPGGYVNNLNVGNTTSYTFSNLTDGQTWYFSVTAYDTSNNESCFSAEVSKVLPAAGDTTPPTTPTNLTATAISSSQINLSWTASTDNVGVTGYRIYRGGVQIATTTLTSYSNTGLSPSTSYSYTVAAYDAAGNVSPQSTAVSATTQAAPDTTPPANISNLSASNIAQTSLQLNWTAPGNDGNVGTAASYDIRYSTSTITLSNWASAIQVTGEPTPLLAGTAQSMTISGLSSITTYYFAIRTTDAAGNISGLSNVVSATTQSFSLLTTLTATPNIGTSTLPNVSLTANVFGTQIGNINYTFYCDRSDSGTNITTPYAGKYDNQTVTSYTATNICSYSAPGTYSAKVIVERGIMVAENRTMIIVNPAPDTTPPTISITSPSSGSTVSGTITVSATASDNVAVAGVQFKLDGANLGVEDTTSPYSISWNTTAVSNGSHTLTATARDTSGNQTTSNSITITVNNVIATTPPSGGGGGGGTLIDTTPPSLPSNTKISMSGNQVVITWTNPTDSDFKGIVIVRKEGSSPTSRTDGNIVYNNNLQNFIDLIDSTKTYYYAVYSYDTNNNYSQPIILKAEPGQTQIISQPAPTTQQPQPQPSTSVSIIIPPTISSNFVFTRYLTIGKSGEEVKKLQELLSANPTIYPEQLITGYYGPATQRAVQRFQETYGIASPSTPGYGEVGPSTRSKLNYFISYRGTYSPSTYSTSTTTSTKPLSKAELIAQLKELIRQIEARILVLLEQLKKLRAGQQ